jgi:hypothetical protein
LDRVGSAAGGTIIMPSRTGSIGVEVGIHDRLPQRADAIVRDDDLSIRPRR